VTRVQCVASPTEYGHLPSLTASPAFDRYQVIGLLLGDRGRQVSAACLRLLRNGARSGLEPAAAIPFTVSVDKSAVSLLPILHSQRVPLKMEECGGSLSKARLN